MNEESKNDGGAVEKEKKPKFRAFAYYADVVKWFITLIGVVVDHVKVNKFPRKDDYQTA